MTAPLLRAPADGDIPAMLALNNAHGVELNMLSERELRDLVAQALCARIAGEGDALLIALAEDAAYASPNFAWFKSRFERFAYIDRVVVAERARGRGLARALYDEVFRAAKASGRTTICCEVNFDPPNPGSDAFHAALGFREIGRAFLADRGKSVRYLVREL